ncbi:MAG: glycosyltransferase/methyltransferase [Rhodospirillaceae bacterium]|nr:glycosyltransferase/methyltransferase [Rhodospirillaceae bacterium]
MSDTTENTSPTPPARSARKRKPKLLIFIVAYNAEKTIENVLTRIPESLATEFTVEVLIIDDASQDETFERGQAIREKGKFPFKLHVLFNPVNQGYGGNQKIGYHFAIEKKFDFVALVHGDGQYAPECLPDLAAPLKAGDADAVFGSRMMKKGAALDGGMPKYKYIGNKVLSWFENKMLRTDLTEFHSGYRLYSVAALKKIPFQLNTNEFHFDSEIIVQFVLADLKIKELEIPTYYGDEICHVDGLKYAWDVTKTVLKARAQELSIFYDRRFDCGNAEADAEHYLPKLDFDSPHSLAIKRVGTEKRVLDLGCAGGHIANALADAGNRVTGIDAFEPKGEIKFEKFIKHNLNAKKLPVTLEEYDYVLMLDVIEHLLAPEDFVDQLRKAATMSPKVRLLVSSGNVGFMVARLMHLIGQFNYGKRGILDLTHTRLFTFATLRRMFEQGGFEVIDSQGIPAPFPMVLGDTPTSKFLFGFNKFLIWLWRSAFSYQMYYEFRPAPSLSFLLQDALVQSKKRASKKTEPDDKDSD